MHPAVTKEEEIPILLVTTRRSCLLLPIVEDIIRVMRDDGPLEVQDSDISQARALLLTRLEKLRKERQHTLENNGIIADGFLRLEFDFREEGDYRRADQVRSLFLLLMGTK
ncbi:MAG: hypothetical protein HYZ61_03760 [Candidatus Andersenbacteria bacterium]|nr:hypothetical protein [Candidatus Andersenbacteria bacterium]